MKPPLTHHLLAALLGVVFTAELHAQTIAFTYQGRLAADGQPASGTYDLRLVFYTADAGGNQVGTTITNDNVVVADGLFTTVIDPQTDVFTGLDRWLEIAVRPGDSTGAFTPLNPRQQLMPTPYAVRALSVSSGGLSDGTYSNAVTFDNPANNFSGGGAGLTGLNASALTGGTVPDARLGADIARTGQVWQLGGNAGTSPGSQFLGTTDGQPIELKIGGRRVLRLEDNGDGSDGDTESDGAPNVIGGSTVNYIAAGVVGATIAGGGATNWSGTAYTNSVLADYGSVVGGVGNTANGRVATVMGNRTTASGQSSTAMGNQTTASGLNSTAMGSSTSAEGSVSTAMGLRSTASGTYSTAMGERTSATGYASTAMGLEAVADGLGSTAMGNRTTASGPSSTAMGRETTAGGDYSVAMGRRAKANHAGTFAWADSQNADFATSGVDQFIVRAAGGVGINQDSPVFPMHIGDGSNRNGYDEEVFIEAQDAVLGLYSPNSGSWGSALVLSETAFLAGNKWAMARTTSGAGAGNENQLRFTFGTDSNYAANDAQMRIEPNGNVRADGAFIGGGADVAESFAVEGDHADYEPGDVLAISTESDGHLVKSTESYSTLIAGVHATKPGVLLTDLGIEADLSGQVPLGVVGVIPTKVCLEGGPIHRGDLLVSSSTPGHAMKADPSRLGFGMIIGKALEPFTGEDAAQTRIKVLVNVK